jgi:hypothetical protein
LPLAGDTAAVAVSVAVPFDDHVETPLTQLQIAGTVALTDRVDTGPTFLLGVGPRGETGPFSAGLFVRLWAPDPDAEVRAALRVEAGWGWVGVSGDLTTALLPDLHLTSSPGLLLTLDAVGARLPLGMVGRVGAWDLGGEAGVCTTLDSERRVRSAAYGGLRVQVRF